MKQKTVIPTAIFTIALMLSVSACGRNNSSQDVSLSNWKSVPIADEKTLVNGAVEPFDLSKVTGVADYVFSGTVVGMNEYEVEWIDESGEQWGPFTKTVLEVKIVKEYYGEAPVQGETILVYYPFSLSMPLRDFFSIDDGCEYVFISQKFDDEFIESREKNSPEDRFEAEKNADVFISDGCYSLLPVINDKVVMHEEFFINEKEVYNQREDDEMSKKSNGMSAGEEDVSVEQEEKEDVIVLDKDVFDEAFQNLFE